MRRLATRNFPSYKAYCHVLRVLLFKAHIFFQTYFYILFYSSFSLFFITIFIYFSVSHFFQGNLIKCANLSLPGGMGSIPAPSQQLFLLIGFFPHHRLKLAFLRQQQMHRFWVFTFPILFLFYLGGPPWITCRSNLLFTVLNNTYRRIWVVFYTYSGLSLFR